MASEIAAKGMALASPDDRVLAMCHIRYEIETMVKGALVCRAAEAAPELDKTLRDISLESSLLHARNLIEFLTDKKSGQSYMRAFQFVPDWKPPAGLATYQGALNEHLSHLTWKRIRKDSAKVPRKLIREVLSGCEAFGDHLRQSGYFGEQPIREVLTWVEEVAPLYWGSSKTEMLVDEGFFSTTDTVIAISSMSKADPLELDL